MIYIQTYICYGCPGYLATSVSDPFNFDGSLDPHLGIVDPDPRILFSELVDPDPGTYFSIIILFLFPEIYNLHFTTL